jgi:hypothetical protein
MRSCDVMAAQNVIRAWMMAAAERYQNMDALL